MNDQKTNNNVQELYGCNVFNDKVMKERLPRETYKALRSVIENGTQLTLDVANVAANAMKDWAIEKGATHYTHWFQPLTNITAEKHDAFISPAADGSVILEFSGKQLIQGEPDASSFPSGGLRATFEARGYTAWDCTSPAFLKSDARGNTTLCIPTVFFSYHGEVLDKKVPMLRSMKAVSTQAMRVLKALGNVTSSRVVSTVGPEQEYFLIDRKYYEKRIDLMLCGRTLFGAPSPKGQELEDQYFGSIKDRILSFMADLDLELWKTGVASKTRHNEVAPAQFEIAPVFSTTNIAADGNQLVMETLQKLALRHGFVCLLHEKPFAGINGSGKHNNWSLSTNDGINLLEPGNTPHDNEQFLVFLCAVIKAVDSYSELLRSTTATSGNDHRLGANEAPPAIISIFLGETLSVILEKIAKGQKLERGDKIFLKLGVDTMPELPKDNTDRNRTSPFAFTGNKFEFRMVGSSASISDSNIVLNTITAETLEDIAGRLEKSSDTSKIITEYIKEVYEKHGKIIFNGNNYSEDWVKEAGKRGLPNIKNTVDALKSIISEKAEMLFVKHKIYMKSEVHSRYEIYTEQYSKHINIEANTALLMVNRLFIPAAVRYANELSKLTGSGKSSAVKTILEKIISLLDSIQNKTINLENSAKKARAESSAVKQAELYRDSVFIGIRELREDIDTLETLMPADLWPVPTYADMLFNY
ncbi:MAG: glutamine synthetase [Spirochaetes bacterium GWF1_41_5]|nr:MAG: glutamine synthetase [Spirochaetes bacterium GWF1_41_5]HBE03434.1 glutamine synthetase type III [Spirochaetia bacterium]